MYHPVLSPRPPSATRRRRSLRAILKVATILGVAAGVLALASLPAFGRHGELPNRIPEPAPYNVDEAQFYPPPYEGEWENLDNPGKCSGCHTLYAPATGGPGYWSRWMEEMAEPARLAPDERQRIESYLLRFCRPQ